MKKEMIKKISDRSLHLSWIGRYNGFYLGYDLMGKMANNTFVKSMLLFNYYSIEEKVSYGITYRKEINSLFYKALKNIAEQVTNIPIFDLNNETFEYSIEVNKKNFNNSYLYTFFKINLTNTTVEENLKRDRLDKLRIKMIEVYNSNLTNLIAILNGCISGSLPLFSYEYEVKNDSQTYYSFKQDIFIQQNTQNLLLEERNISYNPYNIEVYSRLENNRINISNYLKSCFSNSVPSYFTGRGKCRARVLEYFKLDTLLLDFTLPIELNTNKHFNDDNAVFKIKEGYTLYQGKISVKRFFEIKDELKHSFSKLQNFLENLEEIEG